MSKYGITRQSEDETGRAAFTTHIFPFTTLPTVTSHVNPKSLFYSQDGTNSRRSQRPTSHLLSFPLPGMMIPTEMARAQRAWTTSPLMETACALHHRESGILHTSSLHRLVPQNRVLTSGGQKTDVTSRHVMASAGKSRERCPKTTPPSLRTTRLARSGRTMSFRAGAKGCSSSPPSPTTS